MTTLASNPSQETISMCVQIRKAIFTVGPGKREMMYVFDHVLFSATVLGSQTIPSYTCAYDYVCIYIYTHTYTYIRTGWIPQIFLLPLSRKQVSGVAHQKIITRPSTINDIFIYLHISWENPCEQ